MTTQRVLACLLVAVVSAACAPFEQTAQIDDVASGARAGYVIEAVDGQRPNRRRGWIVHYVPFVLVAPGQHVLRLRKRPDSMLVAAENPTDGPRTLELSVDVAAGRRYTLVLDDGVVHLAAEDGE